MSRDRTAAGCKRKASDADAAYGKHGGVLRSEDLVNGDRGSIPVLRPIVTGRRSVKCLDPSEPQFESICGENLQNRCFFVESVHEEGVYLSDGEAECRCETPKSEEHKIPQILCCPPPPKKPKPVAKRNRKASAASFFVPPDLNSIFLPQKFARTDQLNCVHHGFV